MKNLCILGFILVAAQLVVASDIIEVVPGNNILVNGIIDESEWRDAQTVDTGVSLKLYLKQDSTYLYFGIEFLDTMHTGIDLFLAESVNNRKMLHVSSAIGEKNFDGNEWSDYFWGENIYWTANSIGMIYVDGHNEHVPLEGFEFQINKSMFDNNIWHFMIHLKRPELYYPGNDIHDSIEHWLRIKI